MNIQLINKPSPVMYTIEQILYNRGVKDIRHYLTLSDADICEPYDLEEWSLRSVATLLIKTIHSNDKALIVVDCDCDGYTSAALLINYLHDLFPYWVEHNLDWVMHTAKQHGLADHMEMIKNSDYSLIICPDSSSNDYECHEELFNIGKRVIVLDHHLADKVSPYAAVVNNQLTAYPNKFLSGVGVVWQFCRYIDYKLDKNFADNYLDLVALGNCGDMMSLLSTETRYLITKGFKKENIKNPFMEYMIDKNSFPLSKSDYISAYADQACTSMGAAFFIVPFVNAVTRSGTMAEKELIFKSMINYEAFKKIPEIKRNKPTGRDEYLVLQAVRVIGNVKNRQTRAEDAGLEKLEGMIAANNMLKDNMLLFILKPGEIEPTIRGLIANKFMAKYQRPCAILTVGEDGTCNGSMRGYTGNGVENLKALIEQCPGVVYCQGHENAAGLGLYTDKVDEFLKAINEKLSEFSSEITYKVDYFFDRNLTEMDKSIILDIANMNDLWGQDMNRAYVAIKFKITKHNFFVMKSNTIKIDLGNGASIIKFGATDEDIENFTVDEVGGVDVQAVCKCNCNSWNGVDYPQLILQDYEILDRQKYIF